MEMEVLASADFDCRDYAHNATLGPLHVDYVYLHYCVFAGAPLVSAAALLLWLAALFFFLGSTADGYFSPTLANISDKLHVPYDIAGVTFLAFGNGAPDVFSAIAAYASGVGEAGVNELLGGAMFVSTVVVGCVAVASAVRVDRWPFTRDASALLASLLLLLTVATAVDVRAAGNESLVLLFLVSYALYVGSVLVPACVSRYRVARATRRQAAALSAAPDSPGSSSNALVLSAFWHALSPYKQQQQPTRAASPYVFITRSHAEQFAGKDASVELRSPTRQPAPQFSSRVFEDHFEADSLASPLLSDGDRTEASDTSLLLGDDASDDDSVAGAVAADGGVRRARVGFTNGAGIIQSAYWRHLRWRWSLKRRILRVFQSDDAVLIKLLSVPQALLVLVRDVTIPLLDQDAWSRPLATLSPITVPLFVLVTSGSLELAVFGAHGGGVPLWQLALVAGGGASVAVSFLTHRSRPPTTFLVSLFFLSLAFASCVCWIYAVANELMALLVAVGAITHASNSLLGLTVLSWGNSVGDLITNVSVARAGFPQMAIAGCFGGPVFNILLGLGVPTTYALARGQAVDLALDVHARVSLGFLVVSLAASFAVFRRHGFRCPPWYGKLLIGYYAVYTAVNLAIAFRVHYQHGGEA
ncbi:hypothetical protein PybrP1_011141 [[Pythium] brassicae (nom. inval.)]|nr:hypothetical protein PybrP1_011141 [[Pythium] brassicae (nom. inval.)]